MKRIIAIAASLLTLAACSTPSPEGAQVGVRVDDSSAPTARILVDQVVILDKSLQSMKAGKLAVESQGAHRTATGTLRVVAQLRNRTDFPQVVEARTSFFDKGMLPTEDPSGWNRVHLAANGIGTYQESSVGADNVAHYYVEIREAR